MTETLRIVHINEFAGVAGALANAQKELGHEVEHIIIGRNPYDFPCDAHIPADNMFTWNLAILRSRRHLKADVLHVHGGIWRSQVLYGLLRSPVMAIHYHGSETRTKKGLHNMGIADVKFYSTPDLSPYFPDGIWIPNPIVMPTKTKEKDHEVVRFAHLSTPHKGTEQIIELFRRAFGPFKREVCGGYGRFSTKDAELWVAARVSHAQAISLVGSCDVLIDQIAPYGIYGMSAVEAMAYGKPVLASYRREIYPHDCPVMPIDKSAEEVMRRLASDERFRAEKGLAGIEYVRNHHESVKVATEVVRCYLTASR